VAERMAAGTAQQLEGVGVVGLGHPLHGVLSNGLAEGRPGCGVLVLGEAGEQRLLAGRAHICAWRKMILVELLGVLAYTKRELLQHAVHARSIRLILGAGASCGERGAADLLQAEWLENCCRASLHHCSKPKNRL